MSVWQTPHATSRTSTSPALGSARSISCTFKGAPNSSRTAARVFIGRTLLTRAKRHPQARRAHGEAEVLARCGADRRPLEVAREHRQRRLCLQEREVAARAEARAGAERQEDRLLAVLEPAARVKARD